MKFYFNEINLIEYKSEPDYAKIHAHINSTLNDLGHSSTSEDNFQIFRKEDEHVEIETICWKYSSVVTEDLSVKQLITDDNLSLDHLYNKYHASELITDDRSSIEQLCDKLQASELITDDRPQEYDEY